MLPGVCFDLADVLWWQVVLSSPIQNDLQIVRRRAKAFFDPGGDVDLCRDLSSRAIGHADLDPPVMLRDATRVDRKSTRLNSSHRCISYAVFRLKKNSKSVLAYELRN